MTKKTFQSKAAQVQSPEKPQSGTVKKPSNVVSAELIPICLVCAEQEPKYWAFAGCGHRICYVCSLRLRILYGTKSCPICKVNAFLMIEFILILPFLD